VKWHEPLASKRLCLAARELLAQVYGAFTEGFQTNDLQTATAMLEQWQKTVVRGHYREG
jgi:hypothetical protein